MGKRSGPSFFFFKSQEAHDIPLIELLTEEMQLLEDSLKGIGSLIFFLPVTESSVERRGKDLIALSQAAGPGTILAFSSVSGRVHRDHKAPHPVWKLLRSLPYKITTPLLPIVNLGGIKHGEGLWPSLPFDLYDSYLSRMHRHQFAGAIALVNHLPSGMGMLHGSLWIGGQILWREMSSDLLAETWLSAFRNAGDQAKELIQNLTQVRTLVLELSHSKTVMRGVQSLKNAGPWQNIG